MKPRLSVLNSAGADSHRPSLAVDEAVLPQAGDDTALKELPGPVREPLLTTLAPAP